MGYLLSAEKFVWQPSLSFGLWMESDIKGDRQQVVF